MYEYMRALHQRFFRESECGETQKQAEAARRALWERMDKSERRKLLRLLDLQATLQEENSVESFVSGFSLAWGIAKELEAEGLYSFLEEEERLARECFERGEG